MNKIDELLGSVRKVGEVLNSGEVIRDVCSNHSQEILEMVRMQLLEGKAANGENLRPSYSEDLQPGGFFKSRESAKRYADWKLTISYPAQVHRDPDTPNLYINGKFHSELDLKVGDSEMKVDGSTSYADRIMDKYGKQNFGLTDDNCKLLVSDYIYPQLLKTINSILYGKNSA